MIELKVAVTGSTSWYFCTNVEALLKNERYRCWKDALGGLGEPGLGGGEVVEARVAVDSCASTKFTLVWSLTSDSFGPSWGSIDAIPLTITCGWIPEIYEPFW